MVAKLITTNTMQQVTTKLITETRDAIGDLSFQTMKFDNTLQMTNRRISAKLWRNNTKTYKRHRK